MKQEVLKKKDDSQRTIEICLVVVAIGLTCLLHLTAHHKITVLNLFFLPVVLAGFFLDRYRAGIVALFSVISAFAIIVNDLHNFAAFNTPIASILSVTIWGAVLGLTAIMVGSLNHDLRTKETESREAHMGVVEVLARYLQSADPKLQNRAARVSGLSEQVAKKMRLSEKEISDIRVAALLVDIENIEITARVIKKAVGEFDEDNADHTIHGTELVHSLSGVLSGAFPLVLNEAEAGEIQDEELPFGVRILRTVRAFDELTHGLWGQGTDSYQDAIEELEGDFDANYHPAVLHALKETISSNNKEIASKSEDTKSNIEPELVEAL